MLIKNMQGCTKIDFSYRGPDFFFYIYLIVFNYLLYIYTKADFRACVIRQVCITYQSMFDSLYIMQTLSCGCGRWVGAVNYKLIKILVVADSLGMEGCSGCRI